MQNRSIRNWKTLTAAMFSAAALLLLAGCGPATESEETVIQRSNMRSLATAYGQYTKENRGQPPKNEKSFRKWLEKRGPGYLDELQVQSIDDIFISSRDNQPYVVIYGKSRQQIVAYEAEGFEGKRFTTDNLGNTQEYEEAAFRELVPDAE